MPPSPPETRASLILRLPNAADAAAWDEVVAIYGPLVFRLARRRGLQIADADDLVQDVFAAVAKQIEAWLERTDRGRFRAWVLRIARNIAVNRLSRMPLGGAAIGGDWVCDFVETPVRQSELSNQFDLEFQREVFRWAAVQVRTVVSESTWQAFQLTHVDEVPIADAAGQLGISIGAVYIARNRVMKRLRELALQFEVHE